MCYTNTFLHTCFYIDPDPEAHRYISTENVVMVGEHKTCITILIVITITYNIKIAFLFIVHPYVNKCLSLSTMQAAGAVLAYIGASMIQSYSTFESFIQDKQTLIPAAIVIGISVVMLIFGLVGCCATLKESKFGLGCVSACVSVKLLTICLNRILNAFFSPFCFM